MSYRAKQASSNTASKFIEFALVPLLKELEEPKNAIHTNLLAMQSLSKRSNSSVPKTDSFNTTDVNKEDHGQLLNYSVTHLQNQQDNESAAHNNRQDNLSTNIEGSSSFDPVREELVVSSSLKQLDGKKKGGPLSKKSTVRKKDVATLKRFRMRALLSLIDSNTSLSFSQSSNRLLLGSNSFQSGDQLDITNSVNLKQFFKNLQIHYKKLNGMERKIVETLLIVPITNEKVDHLKSLLLNRSAMQVIDDKISSSKLSLE